MSLRRTLALLTALLGRFGQGRASRAPNDPQLRETLQRAREARRAGRRDEARTLFRHVASSQRANVEALRGLRDLAVEGGDWPEALGLQQRIVNAVSAAERASEEQWLAIRHHEVGRAELARGNAAGAIGHFRLALRSDRQFLPATIALGDAHEAAGDLREAMRTWERAAETQPTLPVLARLEHVYRREGRPSRMIALYRAAAERAPDDLSLAAALGRVYFELEMLDEAADQFEKLEVRSPDLPVVHAYLGAVFERRGETREAFEEYRRALRLGHGFDWPHRCDACGATAARWQEQCTQCGRWNTLRPAGSR
jgi:lipopolysaccharide biosynthesis regulator YciM